MTITSKLTGSLFLLLIKPSLFCKVYSRSNSTMSNTLIFRQLFDLTSSTYTYLLGDGKSKEALIIDPTEERVERDLKLVEELGLNLTYVANTHVHADHITGSGRIKSSLPNCRSVISKASGAKADLLVEANDILKIGEHEIEVRPTPGHTNGCVTYVCHTLKIAFTGDAVLIRGCGRTDFQEGCSERLYESVQKQIFSLPDDYLLYPAHDYKGQTVTSVGEEKKFNPRLSKPKEEFVEIMRNLNLAYPKMIDKAVPVNLVCGYHDLVIQD